VKVYIRKIEKNKWTHYANLFKTSGEIKPYVITNDIKTCKKNSLSVYAVELCNEAEPEATILKISKSDKTKIENIALCLAESRDSLQGIDIAFIKDEELNNITENLNDKMPGETSLEAYRDDHVNIEDLSLNQVIDISKVITNFVCAPYIENSYIKFSEGTLCRLFVDRIEKGEVDFNKLKESFKDKLIKKFPEKFNSVDME